MCGFSFSPLIDLRIAFRARIVVSRSVDADDVVRSHQRWLQRQCKSQKRKLGETAAGMERVWEKKVGVAAIQDEYFTWSLPGRAMLDKTLWVVGSCAGKR